MTVGPSFHRFAVICSILLSTSRVLGQPVDGGDDEPDGVEQPTEPEQLSDAGEIERMRSLFEAGKYASCASELEALLEPGGRTLEDREARDEGHVYRMACLMGQGRAQQARAQAEVAIRENPLVGVPSRARFPGPVVDLFIRVRARLLPEIEKAERDRTEKQREAAQQRAERLRKERERVLELERMASERIVLQKNERWLAWVPFGVGQFQNDDDGLGWLFLGAESALLATTVVALSIELQLASSADDPQTDKQDLNRLQTGARTVWTASLWGFLGVTALGIIEANVSYVPEFRRVERRKLPPRVRAPKREDASLELAPVVAAGPGGGQLGITGRF